MFSDFRNPHPKYYNAVLYSPDLYDWTFLDHVLNPRVNGGDLEVVRYGNRFVGMTELTGSDQSGLGVWNMQAVPWQGPKNEFGAFFFYDNEGNKSFQIRDDAGTPRLRTYQGYDFSIEANHDGNRELIISSQEVRVGSGSQLSLEDTDRQTLSGDLTLSFYDPQTQFIDPGGRRELLHSLAN